MKMVHRVNITIDKSLHAAAKLHAVEAHYTDFSGLVTKLIVADMKQTPQGEVISQELIDAAKKLLKHSHANALRRIAEKHKS